MTKIAYVPLTFEGLELLIREAAVEHHKAMGDAQDDWAKWYTEYIWGRTADDHRTIDIDKDTSEQSNLLRNHASVCAIDDLDNL